MCRIYGLRRRKQPMQNYDSLLSITPRYNNFPFWLPFSLCSVRIILLLHHFQLFLTFNSLFTPVTYDISNSVKIWINSRINGYHESYKPSINRCWESNNSCLHQYSETNNRKPTREVPGVLYCSTRPHALVLHVNSLYPAHLIVIAL